MNTVFIITAASTIVYMTGWFIAAQIRRRNDIADVAWGLGFTLVAAVSLIAGNVFSSRGLLISALVLIWGGLFGLVVYGVYDMTNMSTLERWPVRMVWIDICWGCFLCGVTTWFAALVSQWLQ